jgi:tRNA1Val (adenine37-N6)-methyltransferase
MTKSIISIDGMSRPFAFKQFTIHQTINSQKVGTDSMLLGAWANGNYKHILDIGTGTGILALMLAQKNPLANITAIEPDLPSLQEAVENFKRSKFSHQIHGIHTDLQSFGSLEKFDLIITNPPYFNDTFLSAEEAKNRVRQQSSLPLFELYEGCSELLTENGQMMLISPIEFEEDHVLNARREGLFLNRLTRTLREDKTHKRSLMQFSFHEKEIDLEEIRVKNQHNKYSPEYVALTAPFYLKSLESF